MRFDSTTIPPLDHHPQQRLGAGWAQQDATLVAQGLLGRLACLRLALGLEEDG